MKYFGGKSRLGTQISGVINGFSVNSYHEPFCGLYSVGRHVKATKRSGSDVHPDLIYLLKAVQNGWVGPCDISEEQYRELQRANPSALRGFVGFGCSFGGKFFGGFARDKTALRNYSLNASNSLVKLAPSIQGVKFLNQGYLQYAGDAELVYCDPPYLDTTGFSCGTFNHDLFWDWVRSESKDRIVLVSEYSAPPDFKTIWEKSVHTDMNTVKGQKISRVEKLFIYHGI
jgi:DNA adenine methylase